MKAKPLKIVDDPVSNKAYVECEPTEATHVQLHMPGPFPTRIIPVQTKGTRAGTGNWTWNGDAEKPTLKPSILTKMEWGENRVPKVCHTFVNDGKVQFLDDCTHEFAGQTVDLLEVE